MTDFTRQNAVSTTTPGSTFTFFMMLPVDLRRRVYRHALVVERVYLKIFLSFKLRRDLNGTNPLAHRAVPNLALLSTTHKIYEEASEIFWTENTFVLSHAGIWINHSNYISGFRAKLQSIRRLDFIFDFRDYRNFAIEFSEALRRQADSFESAAQSGNKYFADILKENQHVRTCLLGNDLRKKDGSVKDPEAYHKRLLDNMRNCQWGPTLEFIRNNFQLDILRLDFSFCYCPEACCRLAPDVMKWGNMTYWRRGPPKVIFAEGTNDAAEAERILRGISGRKSHRIGYKMFVRENIWMLDTSWNRRITKVQFNIRNGRLVEELFDDNKTDEGVGTGGPTLDQALSMAMASRFD